MGTRAAVVALAMVVGGLWGCGAVPQSKYYQLTTPGEASSAPAGDPLPVTVLVDATDSEEMGTYQTHRWAVPPTEMMQELLWRSLRASNRYSAVYLLTSGSHGDFLLQGNLYDFKELSRSTLAARINIELELRDMRTGAIVWTHSYTHDEPVSGKEVSAVVAALNQNAQRCVSEAAASL